MKTSGCDKYLKKLKNGGQEIMQSLEMENDLQEDTQKDKFLTFTLDKEIYGIDIRYVTEIVGIQTITTIPELPTYVKGIINLRGKIIPVVDVRLKFGKQAIPYNERTCIIVVEIHDQLVGLIVDQVAEVINISGDNIVDPPETATTSESRFIKSIGKTADSVILILNCEQLSDK